MLPRLIPVPANTRSGWVRSHPSSSTQTTTDATRWRCPSRPGPRSDHVPLLGPQRVVRDDCRRDDHRHGLQAHVGDLVPLALQQQVPQLVGVDLRRVLDDEVAQPVQVLRALLVLGHLEPTGGRASARPTGPSTPRRNRTSTTCGSGPPGPAVPHCTRPPSRYTGPIHASSRPGPPAADRSGPRRAARAVRRAHPEAGVGVVDPLDPATVRIVGRVLEDDASLLEPRAQLARVEAFLGRDQQSRASRSMGAPVPCTSRLGKILMVPPCACGRRGPRRRGRPLRPKPDKGDNPPFTLSSQRSTVLFTPGSTCCVASRPPASSAGPT